MTLAIKRQLRIALVLACAASTLWGGLAEAAPKRSKKAPPVVTVEEGFFGHEPWEGQRVLLLLPLELGSDWNLNKEQSQRLLADAEADLQLALQRTGKFSTTQLHRYHPLIQRGVQEKLLTKEQADALIASPTLDGVQKALAPMHFQQQPLIAQVTLDRVNVYTADPSSVLTVTATGKLYEVEGAEPIREVVATSQEYQVYNPVKRKGRTTLVRHNPRERLALASNDAFQKITQALIEPVEEISFPDAMAMGVDDDAKRPVLGTFEVEKK